VGDRINHPVIISQSLGRDCFGHLPHARAVVSTCRTVTLSFPLTPNSGQYRATGAS
jgi:hypothetical protein